MRFAPILLSCLPNCSAAAVQILILSEPESMLDTGIEIVAQPPGKKLQNLQLFPVENVRLTAIALVVLYYSGKASAILRTG